MKNPAAKITESKNGSITVFTVVYRRKAVGTYMNRMVAVKAANERESFASTGYVHI